MNPQHLSHLVENRHLKEASTVHATNPSLADRSVLTLAEVAKELRCSKAHVSNIINRKVPHLSPLPVVRIGRRVLIRHESLNEWMKALEHKPSGVR